MTPEERYRLARSHANDCECVNCELWADTAVLSNVGAKAEWWRRKWGAEEREEGRRLEATHTPGCMCEECVLFADSAFAVGRRWDFTREKTRREQDEWATRAHERKGLPADAPKELRIEAEIEQFLRDWQRMSRRLILWRIRTRVRRLFR